MGTSGFARRSSPISPRDHPLAIKHPGYNNKQAEEDSEREKKEAGHTEGGHDSWFSGFPCRLP